MPAGRRGQDREPRGTRGRSVAESLDDGDRLARIWRRRRAAHCGLTRPPGPQEAPEVGGSGVFGLYAATFLSRGGSSVIRSRFAIGFRRSKLQS